MRSLTKLYILWGIDLAVIRRTDQALEVIAISQCSLAWFGVAWRAPALIGSITINIRLLNDLQH